MDERAIRPAATTISRRTKMAKKTIDDALRGIAGTIVLVSLLLGWAVHPGWYLLTAFVGANLLQSSFTGWCPMMVLLRRLGLRG
jgi:Inner membrane protein YgaP-like, transmembrane domain